MADAETLTVLSGQVACLMQALSPDGTEPAQPVAAAMVPELPAVDAVEDLPFLAIRPAEIRGEFVPPAKLRELLMLRPENMAKKSKEESKEVILPKKTISKEVLSQKTMSSRVVVKNLPTVFTEQKLKRIFQDSKSSCTVTDVILKYTKQGKFRQFGFVGFKSDREASTAVERFDGTFIGASKIKVELCVGLGDAANKPKAWSKHTATAADVKRANDSVEAQAKESLAKVRGKSRDKDVERNKYEDDPLFAEFMDVNKPRVNKAVWSNDAMDAVVRLETKETRAESSDDSTEADTDLDDNPSKSDSKISDLDYLRSKMAVDNSKDSKNQDAVDVVNNAMRKQAQSKEFSVTLRGIPLGATKTTIKTFLKPAKTTRIRRPPRTRGLFHAGLATEEDLKLALNKHRSYLDGHRVTVTACKAKKSPEPDKGNENESAKFLKYKKLTDELEKSVENIAESGMLFVRNLPYSVTEVELEELFKPYGPLAEIRLPVDRFTRKVMGFAIVVYIIPEHAAKAYCELDATTFQGRNLHLLPGKAKKIVEDNQEDKSNGLSSFKRESAAKKKAQSSSSHNWNALFLGANAVADVVAGKYDTTKQELLDPESIESVAVRLALGETQIVIETRRFLLDNGIELDAFSQPATERSKLVILAKNLPAGTSVDEIRTLFANFGLLGRVILPPSGVTAVVEFFDSNTARTAFRSLAYTKCKSSPLYLEWAPVKIFSKAMPCTEVKELPAAETTMTTTKKNKDKRSSSSESVGAAEERIAEAVEEKVEEEVEEEEPELETTIFVKNLSAATTDETLRKHFEKCGQLHSLKISIKKDLENPGKSVSMGYGFVQYKLRDNCLKAMRLLQNSSVDGQSLTLKLSDRATRQDDGNKSKKKQKIKKQTSTKILVRNIPFEATKSELSKLFRTFGELKAVRLPQKMAGTGSHRGFGFVDFLTRSDAKRAFNALCHSTHLYGRRLVLEWAETDDSVESLRRKTAEHFHDEAPVHKRARKAAITDHVERITDEHE